MNYLRSILPDNAKVGNVDKFQGQEAPSLAVVVANPKLLEISCGAVEQMKRVNTFCWLDAYAKTAV